MPQQLIYTSVPRGLVAGRSGYCTVARSLAMREPLILRLEQLSYYHHLSLSGGKERPIYAYRILDIRGARFHVLSRLSDSGLDFTGRTNFIAHHLIFSREELSKFATPSVVLRDWPGWVTSWKGEPQILEIEDWSSLAALSERKDLPAHNWHQMTGDAVNGYALLDTKAGISLRVDDQDDQRLLGLISESVALLELRDSRYHSRVAAWQYTFTTSMQDQDVPADFRWRFVDSSNPTTSRFCGPDCKILAELRTTSCTEEESILARAGRQAPQWVTEPKDVHMIEGEPARLEGRAGGVPNPTYEWFELGKMEEVKPVEGQTSAELPLDHLPMGVHRFVVRAGNSAGELVSEPITVSVDPKTRVASPPSTRRATAPHRPAAEPVFSRRQPEAEPHELIDHRRPLRDLAFLAVLLIAVFFAVGQLWLWQAAPTLLEPKVSNNQIELNWSPVSGAGGYRISRAVNEGTMEKLIFIVGQTNFIDSDVHNGMNYSYRISGRILFFTTANSKTKKAWVPEAPHNTNKFHQ